MINARKAKKIRNTSGSNKRHNSTGNRIWPMFVEGFAYSTNLVSSSPTSSMNASRNHRLTGNARGVSKHAGLRLTRHASRDVSIGERESFGLHEDTRQQGGRLDSDSSTGSRVRKRTSRRLIELN